MRMKMVKGQAPRASTCLNPHVSLINQKYLVNAKQSCRNGKTSG